MPSTQYKIYLNILKENIQKEVMRKRSQKSKKKNKKNKEETLKEPKISQDKLKDIFFTQTLQACVIATPAGQNVKDWDKTTFLKHSVKFCRVLEILDKDKCYLKDENGLQCLGSVVIFSPFIQPLIELAFFLETCGYKEYNPSGQNDPSKRFLVLTGANSSDAVSYARLLNQNEARVLLMSKVGSEGLNLNRCTSIIFLTPTFQPTILEQIKGRCKRMSSVLLRPQNRDTKVRFYFLLAVAPPRDPVRVPVRLASSETFVLTYDGSSWYYH